MTEQEIIRIFEESHALLNGHFKLRSGLHSNRFFQAALLLQYPDKAEQVCAYLAAKFKDAGVETVISPAVGGLIVGQEIARALGCKAIFADKEEGRLVLKRGFSLRPGERVLVAEDVITKGGRVQQTIDLARSFGADVVGAAVLVDRSGGAAGFDVPTESLIRLNLPTFEPDQCPLCAAGAPLDTPGSK
ncbi:orotate phosphoribosyltransferase [Victivallis sp. Marseille-Q1083]|uniref:orotate phosphoribosyltransferase n=1 Tax=Victivallis sp. Marseille-Q1083 TaxID=2717288 RepID=UPI00158A441A|nr:orotate phosphoribosyltransferase [Victivallis sp. Marseille-Q1083]